jgi:hypothetical protein
MLSVIASLTGGEVRDRLLSLPLRGEHEAIVVVVVLSTPSACPFFRRCGESNVVNDEVIEPNMSDGIERRSGDNEAEDDGVSNKCLRRLF